MIRKLLQISLLSLSLALPAKAQDDFIYSQFTSLLEGQASISLVWNLTTESSADARNLEAALLAKLNDGTEDMTPRESVDLRTILAIDYSVTSTPSHLILTMMAPQDSFFEAVDHFTDSLKGGDISEGWLNRITVNFEQRPSTRISTQGNVEAELRDYMLYQNAQVTINDLAGTVLRRPDQIITNARDFNFQLSPEQVMEAFPDAERRDAPIPPKRANQLPSGVIFMQDPDAREALIFLADSADFVTHEEEALANTIYRYMGYGPGSEMFTILRQEKRASYDPQSHFTTLGKRLGFMGLSANVEAAKWQESYEIMAGIYDRARNGENGAQGIEDSKNQMINVLVHDLRRIPNFLVQRYLDDFPYNAPNGRLSLPMVGAAFDLDTTRVNREAATVLPPLDEMLTIVLGGHEAPPEAMRAKGYCELKKNEPLRKCLEALSN